MLGKTNEIKYEKIRKKLSRLMSDFVPFFQIIAKSFPKSTDPWENDVFIKNKLNVNV